MKSVIYIPRKPESIPLFDEENNQVTIMINKKMITITRELFDDLFVEHSNNLKNELYDMIYLLKDLHVPKDNIIQVVIETIGNEEYKYIEDEIIEIIESIYLEK